jgi:hypothetical protein
MNLVRSVISLFLLALLLLTLAGWVWAASLPPTKLIGARIALGLCGLMAIGTLGLLWTAKQTQMD